MDRALSSRDSFAYRDEAEREVLLLAIGVKERERLLVGGKEVRL